MIHTVETQLIADFLTIRGPKVPLSDKSIFRLVFSDDEFEFRRGIYRDFDSNGNFIKEYEQVKYTKKYPYLQACWVIEQWFDGSVAYSPEIVGSINGNYELIYAFCDAKGNALPPLLKVAEIVMHRALLPETSAALKKSINQERYEEKQKKIDAKDWDILNDEGPLVSQFHDGSAVLNVLDSKGNKIKKETDKNVQ